MSKRRDDAERRDAGHGTARDRAEFRKETQFVELLRRFQLAAGAVMLLGLTTATFVCAGEFKQPWLVGVGGGVFVLGLLIFGLARPLARWRSRRK